MKKSYRLIIASILMLSLILAGCASQTPGPETANAPAYPPDVMPTVPPQTPAYPSEDAKPAGAAAVSALADALAVSADEIRIKSVESVEWPDACLGITASGTVCAQVITPGYRVILEANGKSYEYHTDLTGQMVYPAFDLSGRASTGGGGISGGQQAVTDAVIALLATETGAAAQDVTVISAEAVEWPDSCLGIEDPGILCAQMITPGYRVILETGGRRYEYHTDQSGKVIQSASVGLSWSREGGFAGFNDSLVVYLPEDGRAVWSSKTNGGKVERLSDVLDDAAMAQWRQWLTDYGKVEITNTDPAVTDAMSVNLTFQGFGSGEPSDEVKQAMLSWAQNLFEQLK